MKTTLVNKEQKESEKISVDHLENKKQLENDKSDLVDSNLIAEMPLDEFNKGIDIEKKFPIKSYEDYLNIMDEIEVKRKEIIEKAHLEAKEIIFKAKLESQTLLDANKKPEEIIDETDRISLVQNIYSL